MVACPVLKFISICSRLRKSYGITPRFIDHQKTCSESCLHEYVFVSHHQIACWINFSGSGLIDLPWSLLGFFDYSRCVKLIYGEKCQLMQRNESRLRRGLLRLPVLFRIIYGAEFSYGVRVMRRPLKSNLNSIMQRPFSGNHGIMQKQKHSRNAEQYGEFCVILQI